jgi:hypothetical protein
VAQASGQHLHDKNNYRNSPMDFFCRIYFIAGQTWRIRSENVGPRGIVAQTHLS